MGLTAVVTAKSGGSDYPTLAFDGTNGHRIAFVGPNRFPDLAESGSPLLVGDEDEAAPYTYFQHWTPDGLIAGGNRSFKCIGKQNNCLFCELQWRSGRSNLVNVVAYEGYDMKKQTFEGKKVVAFQAPTKVIQDAVTHSSTMGVAFDSIDYFVNKEGTGKTGTKWIVTPIPNVIDQTFDPMELPEQNEGFADEEFPFLVDYFKFDQLQIENRAEQEEAYKKLVGDTTTETAAAPPPGQPLATAAAPVTAPAGGPVALPGKKKGGRPSNAAKAAAAAEGVPPPAPSVAPPPPPVAAAAPPPPPVPSGPSAQEVAAASAVIDGWNAGSSTNLAHLDHVLADANFPANFKEAATLLKAHHSKPAPPAMAPPPAAAPSTGGQNMEQLLASVKAGANNIPTLKNFKSAQAFISKISGGATKSWNSLGAEQLMQCLGLIQGGEAAVSAFISA